MKCAPFALMLLLLSCSKEPTETIQVRPTPTPEPAQVVYAAMFRVDSTKEANFLYSTSLCHATYDTWREYKKKYVTFGDGFKDYYYAWPVGNDILFVAPYSCAGNLSPQEMSGYKFNLNAYPEGKHDLHYDVVYSMEAGNKYIKEGTLIPWPDKVFGNVTGFVTLLRPEGDTVRLQTNTFMTLHCGQRVNFRE